MFKRYIGLAANEQMMSRKASISETVYKQLAADLYGQGNQVISRLRGYVVSLSKMTELNADNILYQKIKEEAMRCL